MEKTDKMAPQEKGIVGGQAVAEKKTERIRKAAALSKTKKPTEICETLKISEATLKRYAKDPRWQEYGGVKLPRNFKKTGRPVNDPETERKLVAEARTLHRKERTWYRVAAVMGMTIGQLEYLRRKYPEGEPEPTQPTPEVRYQLQKAYELRETGMKWNEICYRLGLRYNQLNYLRRKYPNLIE